MLKAARTADPEGQSLTTMPLGTTNTGVNPDGLTGQSVPSLLDMFSVTKKEQLDIPIQVGLLRRIADRASATLSRGIATEARVDWLRVRSTMEPIEAHLIHYAEPKDHLIAKFRLAAELLVNARKAMNLNESWGSINRAGELLSSVAHEVKAEEQERTLLARMVGHEPSMMRWVSHLDNDDQAAVKLKQQLCELEESSAKLEVYSQNWQRINDKMFFSLKLWRFACVALLVTLVIAIGIAELTAGAESTRAYVMVALAGLFGGALSVLLTARSIKISALTYATTRFRFFIRLLLGACGAFVVFTLIKAFPGILGDDLAEALTEGAIGIVALGVIAGFSELLFQNALDRIARRIPSSEPNGDDPRETKTDNS